MSSAGFFVDFQMMQAYQIRLYAVQIDHFSLCKTFIKINAVNII